MTTQDWAYIAGLFDGEGCVTVSLVTRKTATRSCRAGSRTMNLSLRIANNDPRVLLWLEEHFGGKVRTHGGDRHDSFVWIVQGEKSVEAAKRIAKFSRMKKDQLDLFVALHKTKNRSGNQVAEEVWELRADLIEQIRSAEYRRDNLRLVKDARPT